mmetsp:Transcript_21745/g.65057  ORF Transcript_21745/g.65057 Transcript_21745/m.65057 type:complete len:230 (-) Transcript_21745:344-1033(-)
MTAPALGDRPCKEPVEVRWSSASALASPTTAAAELGPSVSPRSFACVPRDTGTPGGSEGLRVRWSGHCSIPPSPPSPCSGASAGGLITGAGATPPSAAVAWPSQPGGPSPAAVDRAEVAAVGTVVLLLLLLVPILLLAWPGTAGVDRCTGNPTTRAAQASCRRRRRLYAAPTCSPSAAQRSPVWLGLLPPELTTRPAKRCPGEDGQHGNEAVYGRASGVADPLPHCRRP